MRFAELPRCPLSDQRDDMQADQTGLLISLVWFAELPRCRGRQVGTSPTESDGHTSFSILPRLAPGQVSFDSAAHAAR